MARSSRSSSSASSSSDRRDSHKNRFSKFASSFLSTFAAPPRPTTSYDNGENRPLLSSANLEVHNNGHTESQTPHASKPTNSKVRVLVWSLLTLLFAVGIVLMMAWRNVFPDSWAPLFGGMPKDPMLAALEILKSSPVIDGHVDLPIFVRWAYQNNVSDVDLEKPMPAHVDIPRLREGHVGGFFWSVYVDCPDPSIGNDFVSPNWRVRDTLEQIDVAHLLINKYPDTFQLAKSSEDIKRSIQAGKIASMLGVEGAHQLGNSLSVLRQYHALGVRYVTLTHTCHNAFADSCGFFPGIIPLHHGLSSFGRTLITEMNRLGVLVDLSHTSDDTALQALELSKAPVIWSHSSSRAVHDTPRNVPDSLLKRIGTGEGQKDAVVMVNFLPYFVAEDATLADVADHIEHIGSVAGKQHVGLGSDFDGIQSTPVGLEDVSKFPGLIAELYRRGWNRYELAGLTGGNLLRVFQGAEKVAAEMQREGAPVAYDIYKKRKDMPKHEL